MELFVVILVVAAAALHLVRRALRAARRPLDSAPRSDGCPGATEATGCGGGCGGCDLWAQLGERSSTTNGRPSARRTGTK